MRISVVLAAGAVGVVLNHFVQLHLAGLEELAATDPLAARARLASEFRLGGSGLFGLTAALGASIIAAARRARRDERFPPTGVWSWGAMHVLTGAPARRAAIVGAVLGGVLIVCSAAGAALTWQIATRLLTCRAGVPASPSVSSAIDDAAEPSHGSRSPTLTDGEGPGAP
jgi:hypothetical protein